MVTSFIAWKSPQISLLRLEWKNGSVKKKRPTWRCDLAIAKVLHHQLSGVRVLGDQFQESNIRTRESRRNRCQAQPCCRYKACMQRGHGCSGVARFIQCIPYPLPSLWSTSVPHKIQSLYQDVGRLANKMVNLLRKEAAYWPQRSFFDSCDLNGGPGRRGLIINKMLLIVVSKPLLFLSLNPILPLPPFVFNPLEDIRFWRRLIEPEPKISLNSKGLLSKSSRRGLRVQYKTRGSHDPGFWTCDNRVAAGKIEAL